MFRIGEFSNIARVSKRLLHYYDEIGLLKPAHIDPQSGYRFYSAAQLPRLTQRLLGERASPTQRRFSDALIAKILGGNALRVLREGWR